MRRLACVVLLAAAVLAAGTTSAGAYWLAGGGGSGIGATATLDPGNQPSAAVAGSTATVQWAQTVFSLSLLGTYPGGGYHVYRYPASGGPRITPNAACDTLITGGAGTLSCVETGLPVGNWKYSVQPVLNSWTGAESPPSATVTVSPSAPSLISATAVNPPAGQTTGDVQLTWNSVPGAGGYNVYRRTSSGSYNYATPVNGAIPVSGTSFTDPGTALATGTTYAYVVRAVDSGVESADSNELSVTPVSRPAAPTGVTAAPAPGATATLNWPAVSGVVGYNVYRRTSSGSYNYATPVNGGVPVAGTNFTDTSPVNGTTYFYVVRAVILGAGGAQVESADSPESGSVLADGTVPTGSLSIPSTVTNSTASQNVTFTASDNVAVASTQCKLDAGAYAACGSPWATGALTVGTHTVYLLITDAAGNTTTLTGTITVDQTPPSGTLSAPNPITSSTASQNVTFTASDNIAVASTQCKLDAGAYAACSSPWATGALTAGSHTVSLLITDTASNSTTLTTTITVDQTPPSGTLTPPSPITNSTASQNVAFTASDNVAVASTQCKLDAGAYVTCGSPFATGALTAGVHTVYLLITDTAGNTATVTATITVDQTPPSVSVTAPYPVTNSTASQNVTFTASDNIAVASTQCKLDAGAYAACTSPFATGALSIGAHTVYVQAIDTAGNVTTQSATITVDQTPPSGTLTPPSPITNSTASQNVAFTASDNLAVASTQCKLDAGAYAACTSPWATGALTVGSHTVSLLITDTAGNTATITTSITVDQTAPTGTLTVPTPLTNSTASQSVTFTASDNIAVASTQCKLDAAAYASCTSPWATGVLTAGVHTVYLLITDTAGNSTTLTGTITVDLTAPTVTVTPPNPVTSSTASQNVAFTASDNIAVATRQCKLNAGAYVACTSPWATGVLAVGVNTVYVRVTDTAGNVTTQSATITVDQTPPTGTLTAPNPVINSTASQNMTFTASDNVAVASTQCRLDAAAYAACTSPWATGTLAVGTHTVYLLITDTAGNATTVTATILVDLTAPTGVSMTNPGSPLRATITLSGTATDASSGVASVRFQKSPTGAGTWTDMCVDTTTPYSCTFDTTTTADGLYDMRALATDNAGNQATSATITSRRIDNTAPAVTLTDPGQYLRGTKLLTATASDAGSGLASLVIARSPAGAGTWTTICTTATSPNNCNWNTTGVTDGLYDLQATATDAAGNVATSLVANRTVDNTAPTGYDVQTTNVGGGTAGHCEAGDTIVLTTSEQLLSTSIISGWSGAAMTVTLRFTNGAPDTITVWDAANTTQIPIGTVRIGNRYVNTNTTFTNSTMTHSGSTIVLTLGTPSTACPYVTRTANLRWVTSTTPTDLAGNPLVSATIVELPLRDLDF